jgi:hypothetical protein
MQVSMLPAKWDELVRDLLVNLIAPSLHDDDDDELD